MRFRSAPAFVRGSRRIIAMILAAMLNDTKPAQNPAQAFSLLLPIKFGSRIRDVVSHFIAMCCRHDRTAQLIRSEEHTSELQSLMRTSYAVFCLKKKKII